ncbi:hypothetical protein [Streptomyces viridosporus]|uniref:Predicted protein n=1 Tax=Streptomyces viridosporus (strain ATCC 14672 / DSM 40746 / JCM 4963 / KCTC 9882 / NRRL B-12104 / FH 1290) TaxID=566461 RepID=D5ZNY6_STRV1|nr:hypothetical protein [Streptomyces viridosporus]EFE72267.1 predicted protein [Streptomyces viridosporus ATCC 14672]
MLSLAATILESEEPEVRRYPMLRHLSGLTSRWTTRWLCCAVPVWWPTDDEVTLFKCAEVRTHRYLYRGNKIPSPWPNGTTIAAAV